MRWYKERAFGTPYGCAQALAETATNCHVIFLTQSAALKMALDPHFHTTEEKSGGGDARCVL